VEKEHPRITGWYATALERVLANTPVVLTFAGIAVALSVLLATRMGSEFVPSLNEGDIAIQALRIPGTSAGAVGGDAKADRVTLKRKFPEIERVFARIGTAEIASDPMPPNISDGYIMLKPESQWPAPRKSRDALLAEIQQTRALKCRVTPMSSRSRSSCASTS
jgi:cobalt-zinc-cadmium resistance protein CzcA